MPVHQSALLTDPKTRAVLREGQVLASDPSAKEATVRWSDGVEDVVTPGKNRVVVVATGGLRYLQWINGTTPAEAYAGDPVAAVVGAVLDMAGGEGTVHELTKRLMGVPEDELRDLLVNRRDELNGAGLAVTSKRVRLKTEVLEKAAEQPAGISSPEGLPAADAPSSNVEFEVDTGGQPDAALPTAPSEAETEPSKARSATDGVAEPVRDDGPDTDREPTPENAAEAATPGREPQPGATPTNVDKAAERPISPIRRLTEIAAIADLEARRPLAVSLAADRDPVMRFLAGALTDNVPAAVVKELAGKPLATIDQMSGVSAKVVATAASAVSSNDLAAMLLLVASTSEAPKGVTGRSRDALEYLVRQVAAELRSAAGRRHERALSLFVSRSAPLLSRVSAEALIELLGAFTSTTVRTHGEQVLAAIVQALQTSDRIDVSEKGLRELGKQAALMPLAESPARQALLGRLWLLKPAEAGLARWWSEVGADDVVAVTDGALLRALAEPTIAAHVAPKVRVAVDDAQTRRRLLTLLASPPEVAAMVDPERVGQAFARIASADKVFAAWRAVFTGAADRAAAESRITALSQERDTAARRLESALKEAAALQSNLERAHRQIDAMREADRASHGANERQLQIDAMRSVARIAALAVEEVGAGDPKRARDRITALVRRSGLETVGEIGAVVTYDPTLHDSIERGVEPGTEVSVRQPGYTWTHGGERVVLARATVETLHV
ncbi:hypothetical protein L1785_13580 [Antribacter sp. KLBMP9083]|uniref:Nucleotide exchange factor GrpE n=1 Tax=Antribacter soli TaxID=2910976 RepID=A0AA41UCF0_9MICO|nr:hypothetical protein [Antribacter soli]MCF4122009.1 hypothetical protein [Antribacter soli]